MAELIVNSQRLFQNIKKLDEYLGSQGIQWTLVSKILGNNRKVLEVVLNNDVIKNCHSIADSRLSSLKTIKSINPEIVTMYIKLPAITSVEKVIKYADISLNSSYSTIEALNHEAERQGKIHRIIVMIEMGELREGVIRENLTEFYERVFKLPNIEIIGIGTNLGCMYGVEPSYDKLIQLSLYREILEAKFNRKIELISGGSSITLPLIGMRKIPKAVNHFRIGEAAFCGTSPLNGKKFKQLSTSVFEFRSNIIEVAMKENAPDGIIGDGNIGVADINTDERVLQQCRIILDFGLVDVDARHLTIKDRKLSFSGTTSDMTVFSLDNELVRNRRKYKVGGQLNFHPDYMAVARLMNSRFIDKVIR